LLPDVDDNEAAVRKVALVVLGVITLGLVVAVTVVSTTTSREMTTTGRVLIIALAIIAVTGGAVLVFGPRRRHEISGKENGGNGP
jgi:FtsH-binding integral membrane protein